MRKKSLEQQEEEFWQSKYGQLLQADERLRAAFKDPSVVRVVRSPLIAAILEANGGCVVGGKRGKDGLITVEPISNKEGN